MNLMEHWKKEKVWYKTLIVLGVLVLICILLSKINWWICFYIAMFFEKIVVLDGMFFKNTDARDCLSG